MTLFRSGRSKFLDAEMINVIVSLVDYLLVHADAYVPASASESGRVRPYKLPQQIVNSLKEILSFIVANRETSSDEVFTCKHSPTIHHSPIVFLSP
jgi:hypothetical protein